jgi:hypothetical protein
VKFDGNIRLGSIAGAVAKGAINWQWPPKQGLVVEPFAHPTFGEINGTRIEAAFVGKGTMPRPHVVEGSISLLLDGKK